MTGVALMDLLGYLPAVVVLLLAAALAILAARPGAVEHRHPQVSVGDDRPREGE